MLRNNPDILIKYPSRRSGKFLQTLTKWCNPRVRIICSFDLDDASTRQPEFLERLGNYPNVTPFWNEPKGKIAACNANLEDENFDLLILASDDMIPQSMDYDKMIYWEFRQAFPDGDGVLHLNDGYQGKQLNTLCILDKKYYDRFGYIYHPSYISLWCDNEFQDVSESLGRSRYVDKEIIRHEWSGHHNADALLIKNQQYYNSDSDNYFNRKAQGFPK